MGNFDFGEVVEVGDDAVEFGAEVGSGDFVGDAVGVARSVVGIFPSSRSMISLMNSGISLPMSIDRCFKFSYISVLSPSQMRSTLLIWRMAM